MIIDLIENLAKYENVNPLFKDVVKFIKENDLNSLENGKHFIVGKDLFVNITDAKGRSREAATIETHKNMIDIQIPLDGSETFGYTPTVDLPNAEYNAEKDITKYPDMAAQSYVTCRKGMMAIFFPQDGHAPCISCSESIHKAIFKVKA